MVVFCGDFCVCVLEKYFCSFIVVSLVQKRAGAGFRKFLESASFSSVIFPEMFVRTHQFIGEYWEFSLLDRGEGVERESVCA